MSLQSSLLVAVLAALLSSAAGSAGVATGSLVVSAPQGPPPGYYDPVDISSPARLRATLHDLIDDHTRFPYTSSSTDTWNILKLADEDPSNSANILDIYKNATYPNAGGGNSNSNREHSCPKSYGFPMENSDNHPFTDTHALFLSDSGYNSPRSNLPYRFCSPSCTEKPTDVNNGQGSGTGTYPGNSNWQTGSLLATTPRPARVVARYSLPAVAR